MRSWEWALTSEQSPYRQGSLGHRHTRREGDVKVQQYKSRLQAKERGFGRNKPCEHLNLGHLAPRAVRPHASGVQATQSYGARWQCPKTTCTARDGPSHCWSSPTSLTDKKRSRSTTDRCSAFRSVPAAFPPLMLGLPAAYSLSDPQRSSCHPLHRPSGHSSHPPWSTHLIQANLPGFKNFSLSSTSLSQLFTPGPKHLCWGDLHILISGKNPSSSSRIHTGMAGIVTQHLPWQPCAEHLAHIHALDSETTWGGGGATGYPPSPKEPFLTPPQQHDTGSHGPVHKTEGPRNQKTKFSCSDACSSVPGNDQSRWGWSRPPWGILKNWTSQAALATCEILLCPGVTQQ